MKEFSIEEKAQAYDEVREKIAIRFGSTVADEIFSQFEMSEDERIRQFLIHEVAETSDKIMPYRNMNKKDVLDWLEKQDNKDEEILILKDQIESLHAAIKAIKETHRIELEKLGKNSMGISEATKQKLEDNLHEALEKETPESFNKFLDKQGEVKSNDIRTTGYWLVEDVEQKPAWSKEDERMIDTIIYDLERHGGKEDSCYSAEINWLKSLKERYTWKPSQLPTLKE